MIVERARRVAAHLREHVCDDGGGPNLFSMSTWLNKVDLMEDEDGGHVCGTVGCIAGWVIETLGHEKLIGDVLKEYRWPPVVARELLGSDHFYAVNYELVTTEIAAEMLERLADRIDAGEKITGFEVWQEWQRTPAWWRANAD